MSDSIAAIAVEGATHFALQNYDECKNCILKIQAQDEKRKADPRLRQALTTCEFFKGGLTEQDKYIEDLHTVAAKDYTASRSRRLKCEYEGFEVAVYNEAVICYHAKRYMDVIRILLPIFDARDQLPAAQQLVAVRVAMLLFACLLSIPANVKHRDSSLVDKAGEVHAFLESQRELMGKVDAQRGGQAVGVYQPAVALCGFPLAAQYRLLLARHALSSKNVKVALKDLDEIHNHPTWAGNCGAGVLSCVYFNNLGVVHMQMNKPSLAGIYFQKALDAFERSKGPSDSAATNPQASQAPLGTGLGQSRHGSALCHVLYNTAMGLMQREQWELAFRSFVVAVPLLHNVPSLWLRMAQCCIRKHERQVQKEKEAKFEHARSHRVPGLYPLPTRATTGLGLQPAPAAPAEGVQMSLAFADKCLRNAHYLLFRHGQQILAHQNPNATFSTEQVIDVLCDDPQLDPLIQSVYLNMVYVALATCNPSIAHHEARQLLRMRSCTKETRTFALAYIVEALCWLNKPIEAGKLLSQFAEQGQLEGAAKQALYNNLAVVHIMTGKIDKAKNIFETFLGEKSQAAHGPFLAIYLELCQSPPNPEKALKLLQSHMCHPATFH